MTVRFEQAQRLYYEKKYNEACEIFESLRQALPSTRRASLSTEEKIQIALMNLWVAKCCFYMEEIDTFRWDGVVRPSYEPEYKRIHRRLYDIPTTLQEEYPWCSPPQEGLHATKRMRRMMDRAISHLDTAIRMDPNLASAFFWRGKIHEYYHWFGDAFSNYVKAAQKSHRAVFENKCKTMFSIHKDLKFQSIEEDLTTIDDQELMNY